MSVQKKRNVIGRDQVQMMISFMEEHSLFARGQIPKLGPQGHVKFKNMWIQLTQKLNSLGPCVLTADKWKEKWKNMRLSSKQRMAAFMVQYNKTGHTCPDIELKEEDRRICEIFGVYGLGLNIRPESGFGYASSINAEERKNLTTVCTINAVERLQYQFRTNMSSETYHYQTSTRFNIENWQIKKQVRPTDEQKDVLLQFMKSHPDFAADLSDASLWEELISLLNAFQPIRNLRAWQRTWADSVKAAKQTETMFNTGVRSEPLSDFHMGIIELLHEIQYKESSENYCEASNTLQTPKRKAVVQSIPLVKKTKTTNVSSAISIPQDHYVMQPNSQANGTTIVERAHIQPSIQGTVPQRIPLMNLNGTVKEPLSRYVLQPRTQTAASTTQSMNASLSIQGMHVRPSTGGTHARQTMQGMHVQSSMLRQPIVKVTSNEKPPLMNVNEQQNLQMMLPTGGIPQSNQNLLMQLRNLVPIGGKPVTASTSAVAEAAKIKSSAFMSAFKDSQQEIINKIDTCFQEHAQQKPQQEMINELFEKQNEILKSIPTIIAKKIKISVREVFQEFLSTPSAETAETANSFDQSDNSEITEFNNMNEEEGDKLPVSEETSYVPQEMYVSDGTYVPEGMYTVENAGESEIIRQEVYVAEGTDLSNGAYHTPNNVEESTMEHVPQPHVMDYSQYILVAEEEVPQEESDDSQEKF